MTNGRVGDARVVEPEFFERFEDPKLRHPFVRDAGAVEPEDVKSGQPPKVFEVFVEEIAAFNDLSDANAISLGAVIKVPLR